MRIMLDGMDSPIPASDIINVVLRTDLVPVPSSVEFAVRSSDELRQKLKLGSHFYIADFKIEFVVVKLLPLDTQTLKDGEVIGGIAGVAIPLGCEDLIKPSNKAVILEQTSFNSIYRALGAKTALADDIPMPYFVCLKGVLPTERLALALQQEACVMRLHDGLRIGAVKIDDLFRQEIKYKFDETSMMKEQRDRKSFNVHVMSVDKDGSSVIGEDIAPQQRIIQRGNLDSRQAKNMAKILYIAGTIVRPLNFDLQAGDLVRIGEDDYVIITSAHQFKGDGFGQGSVTMTKLWVGKR